MKLKRLDVEVDYVRLCPYCKKRKIKKVTCGHFECQYKHHIKHLREYWDKHYRKTDRINKHRKNL